MAAEVRPVGTPLLLALLAGLALPAMAAESGGEGGGRTGLFVQPRISAGVTLTDNLRPGVGTPGAEDRAIITQLSAGLALRKDSGPVRGSLDYSLSGLGYLKTEEKSRLQNNLQAQGMAEWLDGRLILNGVASIGQQAQSVFSPLPSSSTGSSQNQVEVASIMLRPELRGSVGQLFGYRLSAGVGETRARKTDQGDGSQRDATLTINGLRGGELNWSLNALARRADVTQGRNTREAQLTFGLAWRPDVDVSLGVNGGRERNNMISEDQRTDTTYGGDFLWTPTPRTRVQGNWQQHLYGASHEFRLEHRLARSALRYTHATGVSSGGGLAAPTAPDWATLLDLQLQARIPDPAQRAQWIDQFLRTNGLDPKATPGGLLASTASRTQRQEFSASWEGQRLSAVFGVSRNRTQRLSDLPVSGNDDLSRSRSILQHGLNLALSYKLTPLTSLTGSAAWQRSSGDTSALSSDLKSLSAGVSVRLGPSTTLLVNARKAKYTNPTQPYDEHALSFLLTQLF